MIDYSAANVKCLKDSEKLDKTQGLIANFPENADLTGDNVSTKKKKRAKRSKMIGEKKSGIDELFKRKKGEPLPYSKSPIKKRKKLKSKRKNTQVVEVRIDQK